MEIKLEKYVPAKGKNKGKSFDVIALGNDTKFPIMMSLKKVKLVLAHKDAIEFAIKQGRL